MSVKYMSKRKAHAISNGIFLISLAILIFTDAWWPGILLAIWATVASRQYLAGKVYYAIISSVILLGLFIFSIVRFDYNVLAPVILAVGGIFIIVREYFFEGDTNGEDVSEEIKEDADVGD